VIKKGNHEKDIKQIISDNRHIGVLDPENECSFDAKYHETAELTLENVFCYVI